MATLHSVKARTEERSTGWLHFLLLLLISTGAWWLVRAETRRQDLALAVGAALAFILGVWWLMLLWHSSSTWLCRFQLNLAKLNLLPKDFSYWDGASPWNAKDRANAASKAALESVQNSSRELASTRHALDKYLGSEASRQASKGNTSTLGGQTQKVFILFSDIRGFTKMSEQLTPQETMRVLNQIYMSLGSPIEKAGGEINKFIGDAILAYSRRSGENDKAEGQKIVRAALEMQKNFGKTIKASAELTSKSISIGLGIGIVAGEALMGNLGTRNRMEFTLIGDSVNLASRLCGIAPEWEILVNEDLALMVNDQFHIESRLPVQLKGKSEKITPYSILGEMSHRTTTHL